MPGLGLLRVYMLVKDKADIGRVREAVRITCAASTNR